jgi:hypothetical protein
MRTVLFAVLLMGALCAHGKVLYSGSSKPAAQGWLGPFAGTETLDPGGFVTLDTPGALPAGYGRIEPLLESTPGFRLDFTAQLISETHGKPDRAGFSVIVTDGSKHGIEIGFWDGFVWPQMPGFFRDQSHTVPFDTATMTQYSLTVLGAHYQLVAGGTQLLAGDTIFYDAPGFLGGDVPYRTAHALFFGDDTGSASAKFALQAIEITAVPEPRSALLLCSGMAMLVLALRPRRRTVNAAR